jgi:small subunit ribosomal protein S12
MPTFSQLTRIPRFAKIPKNARPALQCSPQKKGICLKIRIMAPKKPNSADRKVARVRLTTKQSVTVAIPGEGHNLQQYSAVLIRGGRVRDLPGVKYKVIRGTLDATGVLKRRQRRSKFGTKNWKKLDRKNV